MIFRNAEISDFKRVQSLKMQVHQKHINFESTYFKKIDNFLTENMFEESINDKTLFILEDDKQILGYFLIEIHEAKNHQIMADHKALFVVDLCVDEKYTNKGYGSKIFEKMEQIAKEKDCNIIELNVWEKNIKAKNFYLKKGMRVKYSNMVKEIK